MSDDDRWMSVIDQVLEALDDAEVSDPSTRDALAEGVRQAIESLESGIGLDVQIIGEGFPAPEDEPPVVEVVTGGRSSDEPPTDGEKPKLRIADPKSDETREESPQSSGPEKPFHTEVKVLRNFGDRTRMGHIPGLETSGWIRVAAGGSADSTWQTIYSGLKPRLYRIACSSGSLDVTVDGEPVERLLAGQSIDAEGKAIRVTTSIESGAIGGYTPVSFAGLEE
jgi:hypothetical protein